MNNVGNFSSDNILVTEDLLNQSLAPLLGDENTSIGIDAKSGAYVDSISREAASLSLIQEIIPEPNTPQRPLRNTSFSSISNYNNLDALTGAEVVDQAHGQLDNQAILKSALALSESKLQTFLERTDSLENLNQAFGNNWHPSSALALIKDLISEKALPSIQILAASTLKAQGAFDGQKIYLSQQLIDSQDTNEISSVFLEEFGHYLDSRLNTTDSEGDEGEIFSRLIQNLPLDLATLKAEDDFGSLNLDGQEIAIEKAAEAGIFTVNSYGKISVDWMADAGSYQGELAIFSLKGMETLTPGGSEYIEEAARRALTNKDQGYVILKDATEGAKLNGELGEANQNQGNYMGVRDFAFAPGTQVAFLLVPVGTVQEVFDNPSTQGNQRPLFSLASANPLGKTHLGKLAEDTFVWEDIRFDNNSDADYNDLVVSVQGLTGEVTPLEQLIAPQQDWRSTQSAQEMMKLVHTHSASDTTAPKISFQLVEDSGGEQKDGITNNPAISGQINDSSPISKLEAQLNNGNWLEITDTLAADSSFALSQEKLAQIFGQQLADGNYQLAIKATDTSNNTSEAIKLNFTFDTTAPISPIQLGLLNDNNKVTSNNQPIVTGVAPTAAQVKLYSGNTLIGEGTVVDEQWQITSNSVLTDGTQKLSAVAIDAAGNLSRNSNLELLIDTIAPQLIITSPQYNALIAKGTRLQGTVNGTGSEVMQLSYQFNDLAEVPIAFDSNGKFDVVLNLDNLKPGAQTLTVKTIDAADTSIKTNLNVTLTLDTTAPVIQATLLGNTKISNNAALPIRVAQNLTDNPTIIGKVSDSNSGVTLLASVDNSQQLVDVSAYLKADGSLIFERQQLEKIKGKTLIDGEHSFTFIAKDQFGNQSAPFNLSLTIDSIAKNPSPSAVTSNKLTENTVNLAQNTSASASTVNTINAAIKAEGSVNINGNSDFDGEPLNLNDDAFIYAGKGFSINGKTVLPVKRNAAGNPLTDSSGKQILVDKAVTVTNGYLYANVSASNRYSGLVPPMVVDKQTIDIPVYTTLLNGELNSRIPNGTPTVTFNAAQNPLNNASDWTKKFPSAGTTTVPTVVKVTGGGLNVPNNVTLNNYVITVESGDLNFNGSGHNLNNSVLVTKSGNINFANAQTKDVQAFASGSINMNGGAKFAGTSLLANSSPSGSINFNGATATINSSDELKVISSGSITYNGASQTRGSFLSTGNFTFNGNSTLYGSIGAKGDIYFNGNATVVGVNSNSAPSDLSLNPSNSPENVANNSVIGTFTTTDANSSDTHTYQLVAGTGDTHNNAFNLSGNQLKINNSPDFELLPSYTIRVRTTDSAGVSLEKSLIISVTNVNEAPTQLNLDAHNLVENSALGITIGNFSTLDPDAGDAHSYSLVTGAGDVDNNAFKIVNKQLNLNSAADFESKSNYSIRVRTTDVGGLNVEQVIKLNVTDVNEAPTAVALNNFNINENAPNNSVVGIFNISDPDLNSTHNITLVAGIGDLDNAAFTIVGNQLKINNSPDFESKASYSIRVKATDVGGLNLEQTLTININDLNEAPTNLSLSNNNFEENLAANSQIATLTTIDPDFGDTHHLTLVTGSGDTDNANFTISGVRLYLNNSADFESLANYNIRVQTTDKAGNSLEKILYLNVNNVNEAPTQLNLSNLSIDENAAIDSIIGTFSTSDPDFGDTHTFSLVAGIGSTDNGVFTIAGNQLHLNVAPDFEIQPSYSIRVKTTDAGGLSKEQVIAINVSDLNEAPTGLSLTATSVVENSPIDTVVATLNTVDPDANDTHIYNLVTGDGDANNTAFNLVAGELRFNNSPDFESQSSYSIRVRTTDADGLATEKAISLKVTDVNEPASAINLTNNSIAENSNNGTEIGQFSSTDPDADDTHIYTLLNDAAGRFELVGERLLLKDTAAVDFEQNSSHTITVQSSDKGGLSTTANFTIEITDVAEVPVDLAIAIELVNDTGSDKTDKITSEPTIKGTIENIQGNITLQASLSGAASTDLLDLSEIVQPDGSFTLGLEQLKIINGGSFDNGTYVLRLTATDSVTFDTSSSELTFTFDNSAPTLNLITPLANGDHTNTARLIGQLSETATLEYVLDGGETKTVTANETGQFDRSLDNRDLNAGTHLVKATATDNAGNQTNTEVSFQVGDSFLIPNGTSGWVAQNQSTVILGEQDSYVVQTTAPVALGLETNEEGKQVGTRTISFDVQPFWDKKNTTGLEDQLLVYLVDPANPTQTLLDRGTPGTAIFSLTGEQSDFTPGLVSFDGKTVTIDASSLKDVNQGLLVFQLLNQDSDIGSVVTVNNLSSTTDLEGFANPVFPENSNSVPIGKALNLDNLTQATNVETIIDHVSFNSASGQYSAQIKLKNNGQPISRNVAVVFNNLPDGVELVEASGKDNLNNPYINLRAAIGPGGLDQGGVSKAVEVVFSNPELIRFGLNPTVLVGSPNVAPVFEPIGNLIVIPGQKLEIPLSATDSDGDKVTYKLQADGDLPTGMLAADGTLKFNPKPNEIGSYEFTLIATDGAEEVSQNVTLDVVADPITTTRISGVIQNVEQQPLAGVVIKLGELQSVTAADGSFTIETDQPLTDDSLKIRTEGIGGDLVYPSIAEKLPLLLGQEVYSGFNNVIDRPIYLPALDIASGQVIDPSVDTTVTTENIPGASVFVKAGSLSTQGGEAFTGTLSITEVPTNLTPAALPKNLFPDLVVTIQPGDMVFNTPAPLSLPNREGYAPGTKLDLWSINPQTGNFDKVGKSRVSDDGSVIETISGGIRNSSWHFIAPPALPPLSPEKEPRNPDDECNDCKGTGGFNSEVEFHSGAVIETHNLTTYSANGTERGVTLTYDSLRADPRPIVHFGFESIPRNLPNDLKLIASLTVKQNGFDYVVPGITDSNYRGLGAGDNIWSIPQDADQIKAALQADLRELPSGQYEYQIDSGIRRLNLITNNFGGSSTTSNGKLLHINSIDSPFGTGWGISGWQQIVENNDGTLLLIDGDGSELLFEAPLTQGGAYISPAADFSTLEKLADGTFRRTMKDQMVYQFNQNNQLANVSDSNHNQTQFSYDNQQRLTEIVDSVGLATTFTYDTIGKINSITDPAGRVTELEYDSQGNLIRITDPDGTARNWSYDSQHHMIAEVDPRGNRETSVYDQFGRATQAIRQDGSVIKLASAQTEGLYGSEATTNPNHAPVIPFLQDPVFSSYVDGDGNVVNHQLDQAGQIVASRDGEGGLPSLERNDNNLITTQTNARGFDTNLLYDKRGNIIKSSQQVTSPEKSKSKSIFPYPIQSVGYGPEGLVSGDFNHDGILDVVTATFRNGIVVSLGKGNGTFKNPHNYLTGYDNSSGILTTGDFNNDGFLDLVSTLGRAVKVLFNKGDGTFSQENFFSNNYYYTVGYIEAIEVGDFDHDGYLDLATTNYANGSYLGGVSLLFNNKNGTLANPVNYDLGERTSSLAVIDLNNDGLLDLAAGQYFSKNISILLNNGNGSLAVEVDYALNGLSNSLAVGDLNNDGNQDLITTIQNSTNIAVLLSNGDGTLKAAVKHSVTNKPLASPVDLETGDFNDDGLLDVVTSNQQLENISLLEGLGDGTFKRTQQRDINPGASELTVGDFDLDGQIDLVSTSFQIDGFLFLRNQGNGDFSEKFRLDQPLQPKSLALGDLNGDQYPDLVSVSYLQRKASIFIGNGNGSFVPFTEYDLRSNPSVATLADLNADGILDLITSNNRSGYNRELAVFVGKGDGTFTEQPNYYDTFNGNFNSNSPEAIFTEDLNHDGFADVVVNYGVSKRIFSVLLNNGNGTLADAEVYNTNAQSWMDVGDVDNDGNADIVIGNSNQTGFSIRYGLGDGTFADAVEYNSGFQSNTLALGDLNNDGLLDLVATKIYTDKALVVLNNGERTFGTVIESDFGKRASSASNLVKLGDFNLDGNLDLVMLYSANSLFVALGKGNGTFTPEKQYSGGNNPINFALTDVNLDSYPDLLALNSDIYTWYDNYISVLLNKSSGFSDFNILKRQYTYDPTFNQVTNYTDELGHRTLNPLVTS